MRRPTRRSSRAWTAAGAVALLAGCATIPTTGGGTTIVPHGRLLVEMAAFEHGCAPERIVLLRNYGDSTYDLNVCGQVRRYKALNLSGFYLDVTALYPPGSLPSAGK